MPVEEYARLTRIHSAFTRPWRFGAAFAIGVAALFSQWTFMLGCLILLAAVVSIVIPSMVKSPARELYRQMPDMRGPVKYAVSETELSFTGGYIDASCLWPNLVQWRQVDGWLVLFPSGLPHLFFRVADLSEAGVLNSVMQLAKKNGVDYDHPNA